MDIFKVQLRMFINKLMSKGMPNISLKATIEKNCHSQNLNLPSLKNSFSGKTLGARTDANFFEF